MTSPARSLLTAVFYSVFAASMITTTHAANEDLDELQTKLGKEWVLVKNDQLRNIKSYAKQEDGKRYRSFKVEAVLDSTIEAAVRVMLDFDNYYKWHWQALESKTLQQVLPTEYYFYLKHRAPATLPDRDAFLRMVIVPQKKPSDPVIVNVRAVPDYVPENPPLVRVLAEDMIVEITPLASNKIQIKAEGYADPGGRVPLWANNYVQRSAPYQIILGFLRMTMADAYQKAKSPLPFKVYNDPQGY